MSRELDLIEEGKAADALIKQLTGKPLVETSGDEEHRLNPTAVKISVKLSEKGDEINFQIAQTDRHHPHLMYDTVVKALSEMPQLKDYSPKKLDQRHDYDSDTNVVTIRYDLPKGKADDVIHALSTGSQSQSWADKVENPTLRSAIGKAEDWISQLKEHFPSANSRA